MGSDTEIWRTPQEQALTTVRRKAMNDDFEVAFSREDFPQGIEAALDALDEVERIEQELSLFRFNSKVQFVNRTAHESPVPLEPELFHLIALCIQLAEETDGAVDISSGTLWKVWGFAKRDGRIPTEEERKNALTHSGYKLLELDESAQTIRFKKQGLELNFGCVGKGFALDIAAEKLRKQGVDRFMFQGGLSSILTSGTDWKLGIAHPLRPGQRLQELTLNDAAVSTSGSQKQFFRYKGRRYSHLIDPRSGEPADGVYTATVLAPTATWAELLSTAFFVLGPEKSAEYCYKHPEVKAVLTVPAANVPDIKDATITMNGELCIAALGSGE